MAGRAPLRIWLLGGFRVAVGDCELPEAAWCRRHAADLVKVLAFAPAHRLHRDEAVGQLWPDRDHRAAANALHQTLHAARGVLEPELGSRAASAFLPPRGDLLTLVAAPLCVDVDAFQAAAVATWERAVAYEPVADYRTIRSTTRGRSPCSSLTWGAASLRTNTPTTPTE